jgi:hypothetical protein
MNRARSLQDRRMQKFRDVLSRWSARSCRRLRREILGCWERQFRRYRVRYEGDGLEGLIKGSRYAELANQEKLDRIKLGQPGHAAPLRRPRSGLQIAGLGPKQVNFGRPPFCHLDPVIPIGGAVICPTNFIGPDVAQLGFNRVGKPLSTLVQQR